MYNKKPWLKFYGDAPQSIDYPRVTMYDALMQTVKKYPEKIAYDFLEQIDLQEICTGYQYLRRRPGQPRTEIGRPRHHCHAHNTPGSYLLLCRKQAGWGGQ